jgi:pilus assembly protein CpaB
MSRIRLLLVVALLIVLIGVGAAVILPGLNNNAGNQTGGTPGTPQREATRPAGGTSSAALPTYTPFPTLDIVVAIQPIGRGSLINPDMVALRTWPEESAPINAFFDTAEVIGKIARTDIVREQPILTGLVTADLSGLGAVGSDAAAVLPPGTRLISMPVDGLTTGAYAIQPGDRVDAIISLLFVDLDEEFQTILPNNVLLVSRPEPGKFEILAPIAGRSDRIFFAGEAVPVILSPAEYARPRLTTQMTIQDALVIYMGAFPPDGRIFNIGQPTAVPSAGDAEPTEAPDAGRRQGTPVPTAVPLRPDVISLAVSPQDAVVMTYYVEAKIPVTFALRPANETGTVTTQPVTLEYIMSRYTIQVPRKLPYGVEPAIRSIRQLVSTNELTFANNNTNTPQQPADNANNATSGN